MQQDPLWSESPSSAQLPSHETSERPPNFSVITRKFGESNTCPEWYVLGQRWVTLMTEVLLHVGGEASANDFIVNLVHTFAIKHSATKPSVILDHDMVIGAKHIGDKSLEDHAKVVRLARACPKACFDFE
jgi:hypothetical protein